METLNELIEIVANFADQVDEEMKKNLIAQAGSYTFGGARRNFGGKYFWHG